MKWNIGHDMGERGYLGPENLIPCGELYYARTCLENAWMSIAREQQGVMWSGMWTRHDGLSSVR